MEGTNLFHSTATVVVGSREVIAASIGTHQTSLFCKVENPFISPRAAKGGEDGEREQGQGRGVL